MAFPSNTSDPDRFALAVKDTFLIRAEVFGNERANLALSNDAKSITDHDIATAIEEYSQFLDSFDAHHVPHISCILVSPGDDISRIDQWYQRDGGRSVGEFTIYNLTPRN